MGSSILMKSSFSHNMKIKICAVSAGLWLSLMAGHSVFALEVRPQAILLSGLAGKKLAPSVEISNNSPDLIRVEVDFEPRGIPTKKPWLAIKKSKFDLGPQEKISLTLQC